jgi:hypothetical protein
MPAATAVPVKSAGAERISCAVDECQAVVLARGWCVKHYTRWKRYGDPAINLRAGDDRRSRTAEYRAWRAMLNRCYNATLLRSWPHYGGQGIGVCDAWRTSFHTFLVDVGLRPTSAHTLDRINSTGNYEPGNVRWATRTTQTRNRAITRLVNGVPLMEACQAHGVPYKTAFKRLSDGWSPERAVSTPPRKHLSYRRTA